MLMISRCRRDRLRTAAWDGSVLLAAGPVAPAAVWPPGWPAIWPICWSSTASEPSSASRNSRTPASRLRNFTLPEMALDAAAAALESRNTTILASGNRRSASRTQAASSRPTEAGQATTRPTSGSDAAATKSFWDSASRTSSYRPNEWISSFSDTRKSSWPSTISAFISHRRSISLHPCVARPLFAELSGDDFLVSADVWASYPPMCHATLNRASTPMAQFAMNGEDSAMNGSSLPIPSPRV